MKSRRYWPVKKSRTKLCDCIAGVGLLSRLRQFCEAVVRRALFQLIAVVLLGLGHAIEASDFTNWHDVSGPYLGQKPPGMAAELFAPGLISTDQSETGSVFSPDYDEFYFTTWTRETGTKIMITSQIDGAWTAPAVASFSNHPSDVDVAISIDGTKIFFGTRRPRPGEVEGRRDGFDIWNVNRTETGWGKEEFLGPVVNSGKSQVYPTVTRDGTLYFQAVREEGYGKADIYRSRLVDGVYKMPENLGPDVNSEHYEGDVYVAPDESYIIVSMYGREDNIGDGDLYISFQNSDGAWSRPRNMGPDINSEKRDFCPMVTPDGKYLFFSSKRLGVGDIFWVGAAGFEAFRDD